MNIIKVKTYKKLTGQQNDKINTDITDYLTTKQKSMIESMVATYLDSNEPIRIKAISAMILEPCFIIKQYMIKHFGRRIVEKIYYTGSFIELCESKKKNQYVRFTDFRYKRSQYVVAKELDVPIECRTVL